MLLGNDLAVMVKHDAPVHSDAEIVGSGSACLKRCQQLGMGRDAGAAAHQLHRRTLEDIGLPPQHPASFRLWLKTRVEEKAPLAEANYICGDAPDMEAEIARYSALLAAAPIDCAFVGFGENGHIAFNDPPSADFDDPVTMKIVELDLACRRQQVGEGHFKDIDSVPRTAITITCSGLFRADAWICCVPERRKSPVVRDALTGPINSSCPASVVRRKPSAWVFLDEDSASLLELSV